MQKQEIYLLGKQKTYQKEFLKWFKLTNSINPLRYFKETEISTPTLYVMEEDYMFLPPVEQIVAQHKYSFLEIIENCGHVCNVEKPRDFNKLSIHLSEVFSLIHFIL